MKNKLFVVKYSGPFGFIKPWTAVRDSETFSQQFLTPSIVEGIEKKLFPELLGIVGIRKIVGHRLSYDQISQQQEVIQTRGWNSKRKGTQIHFERPTAIIVRGLLLNPVLFLAFENEDDADVAFNQHICLCRNEDILLPIETFKIDVEDFDNEDTFSGFELMFEKNDKSFPVGIDRNTGHQMFGWLKIIGTPVKEF
ncbi:hypothetical protein [Proteiniphilum propionicum]|jgi:hypothetical protein|uniref:hypothetical protein n=1 Tax=Proteiniphilum propionicum TaxID=2829812 RepID=UPI000F0C7810|nr:hypothetical protein [Proteiniphilum propionicum]ULB35851.1 hypothetical protein KDN43_07525 [Proteiniphilum propionicum]BBD45975.1 hypothetical protein PEIBARAKI_5968 [Petrimonas sp. IBARAKI]